MSLSPQQNAKYRPVVKEAWLRHAVRNDVDRKDKGAYEKWYRNQLVHESGLGIYSTKEINTADEFGKVLLHFAVLANDQHWIDRLSSDEERRALWLLDKSMANAEVGWPYVEGIARKMGFDTNIQELPAEHILKINTAVYLYYKRKQKKALANA